MFLLGNERTLTGQVHLTNSGRTACKRLMVLVPLLLLAHADQRRQ